MKKLLFACLSFTATVAIAQKDNNAATKFANLINPQTLREKLAVLASDEMEGRETATPGQKKAAAYIEAQFKRMGLKPGNGDSYQQYYPVYQDQLVEKSLQVNGQTFMWDADFSCSLNNVSTGTFQNNNLVFAGYGLVDAKSKIDDYAGLDVKGKVVIVLEGANEAYIKAAGALAKSPRFNSILNYYKMNAAVSKGAVGLITVSKEFPLQKPTNTTGNMYLKPANANNFFAVTVSPKVASALTGRTAALTYNEVEALNKGNYTAEVKLMITKKTDELQSSNVIAVLPGTDKKDEYVFLTGHYDHLGTHDGKIYYGADDDGSGTTSVMQMAEAFAAAAKKGHKPRRTIVFMTVSGEEKGLWGSEYYSEHPIFPLDKTSVDLNTDMVGRVDTERKSADSLNYIYVIGHDKLSSELPVINEAANNVYTKLTLDYKYDDPKDENRIYYRSDHYNFAKKGVPILFFYDGMLLADYHKPTDTIEKINFDLMEKRVKLVFYTAWDMANRDDMLKRDTPLNMPSTR